MLTSGWFRWRAIEDDTGRARHLIRVLWLDGSDELHATIVRDLGDDGLSIESGDVPSMFDELHLLDELRCELARSAYTPSRALWHADRRRAGDSLDARIAAWELRLTFSRPETLLEQLVAKRDQRDAARMDGAA